MTGEVVVAVLIGFYLLCSTVGFGILAYRKDKDLNGGQALGLICAAPLALGYQCGALVREVRQGRR